MLWRLRIESGCDKITVCIKFKRSFGDSLGHFLEQKWVRVVLRKCSGVVRSTKVLWADVKAGTWKLFCFLTEFLFVGKQNIFSRGEKNVFSAQNWFEYWSRKFLVAWRLSPHRGFKRYVKTCRKRFNGFEATLLEKIFLSAHGCFGRPKSWYGCSPKRNLLAKWEYEIVSKRISELLFFSTYAFERTFENEQISSNVHFRLSFTD